jgi:biopolymer transport protein ExbD
MSMSKLRKGHRAAPVVEINMIPLIDVSLVLLIIFMVMSPLLVQQQIKINLPHATTGAEAPDRPVIITVQGEGELSLNGRPVAATALESELRPLIERDKDKPVVIQADRNTPLQRVVSVMDIAKRLEVARLGISVEQPKQ